MRLISILIVSLFLCGCSSLKIESEYDEDLEYSMAELNSLSGTYSNKIENYVTLYQLLRFKKSPKNGESVKVEYLMDDKIRVSLLLGGRELSSEELAGEFNEGFFEIETKNDWTYIYPFAWRKWAQKSRITTNGEGRLVVQFTRASKEGLLIFPLFGRRLKTEEVVSFRVK